MIALLTPRDLAIGVEVGMILGGLWFARFARDALRNLEASQRSRQQLTIQPSSGSRSAGKP
jgi:hypothetical protein